jgi:hypothetical protein
LSYCAARLAHRREWNCQQRRVIHVVESGNGKFPWEGEAQDTRERLDEQGCGEIVGADHGVKARRCKHLSDEACVGRVTGEEAGIVRREVVERDGFAAAGKTEVGCGGVVGARKEAQMAMAERDKMAGESQAGVKIIDTGEIEVPSCGEVENITIEKGHGDVGGGEGGGDFEVDALAVGTDLDRGEEYAVDAPIDVEVAEPQCLLSGGGAQRSRGIAPEDGIVARLREAGDFVTDGVEDFGVAQARDNQAECAVDRTNSGGAAQEGAGAGTSLDESGVDQFADGACRSGARDLKSLGKFVFTGETFIGTVLAGGDLRLQGVEDRKILRGGVHVADITTYLPERRHFSCRKQIDCLIIMSAVAKAVITAFRVNPCVFL